ncbi:MAG TPA: ATP-binding protein [Candidatus Paceibacterota bacterium]|nr:ATP-binding protein [Candidatus Paceibacterota bacterium]
MSTEELNNDKEWLELVLENSSDAIIIIDRERRICYANKAAAGLAEIENPSALFGVEYDTILAQHAIYDENGGMPNPDLYPSNIALFRGTPVRNRILRQMHRTSGKQRWLSISSIPLFVDANMQARYAIVFFTDISDRKLREDRVQFLIESSKILSVTSDLHERVLEKAKLIVPLLADWCTVNLVEADGGVERIAVVHRDPSKQPLVARLAELSGERNPALATAKSGKPNLQPILSTESLEKTFSSEEGRALLKSLHPVSSLVVPITSGDRVLGALSLAYSDSGRIYTQEDLEFMQDFAIHVGVLVDNVRLYQEIEKRDKSKDAFIAALSHELRNPLAPIKSALEFLKLKNSDPEFSETLDMIGYQFDHINQVLRDLLDVNRFQQGTISVQKKVIDVRSTLQKAAAINRELFSRKSISLHLLLPGEGLFVNGDETRIQQAVMNIIHNAEKFTPQSGNVWIEGKHVADRVVITIRDDGAGIDAEDIPTLFDPYARRQSSTGLGLGLSLVRNIMRLHGGEVSAQSPGVGRGCTFELDFPSTLRPSSEEEQPALPLPSATLVAHTVLIVDDNQAAAKALQTLLRHYGHTVSLAHTGMDALRKAKTGEKPPTVFLVDIGLPDISGYEVARRLRAEFGDQLMLIALTGYGQQEDVREAREAGFSHHLTKPVSIVDILKIFSATGKDTAMSNALRDHPYARYI